MIKLELPTSEINKVVTEVKRRQTEYEKNLANALKKGALDIESTAKQNVTTNTGRLKTSIVAKHDPVNISSEVVAGAKYAPYVEFGTKGRIKIPAEYASFASQFQGQESGNFRKLVEAIGNWARERRIEEEAVFPIALSIAKNGVKAQPFLLPAYEQERPKIIKALKRAKI